MTYYIKNGLRYDVYEQGQIEVARTLPPANFLVKENPRTEEFYLEQMPGFVVNQKMYGDTLKNADRIFNTFMTRDVNTGVMLAGEKGSGKTLLARVLGERANKQGMPLILINQASSNPGFCKFVAAISEPAVILIDEFEKTFRGEVDQSRLLSLLDGTYTGKKLFILTCNDTHNISSFMKNRPGRVYYTINYTGLEAEFIREYCDDVLNDKTQIDSVCKVASLFAEFNFDMLKAIVEEMNRYNESAEEAIKLLNASPDSSQREEYTYILLYRDTPVDMSAIKDEYGSPQGPLIHCNPLRGVGDMTHRIDENNNMPLDFDVQDLVAIDPVTGQFTFKSGDYTLSLTRKKRGGGFAYSRFL